tara:strand:- start:297 stop:1208 length:912 start_codon:yes stop_codon:yes gene_type:complete
MKKNFLHVDDLDLKKLNILLDKAKWIKNKFKKNELYHPFENKTMSMIFAKPSARTRISFETGFYKLGGHALYLGPNDIGIGKRESVADIAKVLSRFNDIIMARLFKHSHILELAENATVPVVNGLTDFNHPCQIMADIFTISEKFSSLDGITIAYVGDGNNIVHSWLELASILPINFNIVCPENFRPDMDLVNKTKEMKVSNVNIVHDSHQGVKDADVIYTDVWASMGQKEEADERRKIFKPYQVNKELMNSTGKNTLFMHCLPAERGIEVTDDVCDSKNSIIFDQAENRMHMQNAIMLDLLS